ncbi:MAG: hypothetical protein MUP68_01250 [Deltaproteobacteria bacterium]|jgi:hypothetical protein|nr:hypothetical protein [Deltaproteobacteria bacterium]
MAMKLIVPNIRIAAKIIKKILKRTRMGFLSFVLLFIFRKDHLLKANLVKLLTIKRLIKKESIINPLEYQGNPLRISCRLLDMACVCQIPHI